MGYSPWDRKAVGYELSTKQQFPHFTEKKGRREEKRKKEERDRERQKEEKRKGERKKKRKIIICVFLF